MSQRAEMCHFSQEHGIRPFRESGCWAVPMPHGAGGTEVLRTQTDVEINVRTPVWFLRSLFSDFVVALPEKRLHEGRDGHFSRLRERATVPLDTVDLPERFGSDVAVAAVRTGDYRYIFDHQEVLSLAIAPRNAPLASTSFAANVTDYHCLHRPYSAYTVIMTSFPVALSLPTTSTASPAAVSPAF